MTDAFKDLKALNKTYREMIEGCGCDKKKTESWPSIKDAKPPTKTNVKYDKDMKIMAPTVKESLNATCLFTEEELDEIMEKVSAFDMIKKDLESKGHLIKPSKKKREISPEESKRRYDNYLSNTRKDNPYKARPGESD